MKFLRKFESNDVIKEEFYNAVFDLVEEKIGNLFDLFTDVSDEYDIDLNITISIYYDPYDDEMYDAEYVMKINDQMEIIDKGDVDFIDWHFTIKNFDLVNEDLIIYQLSISTNHHNSEFLEDVVYGKNNYIDRVSNMYDFYRISRRSSHFGNGITRELKILCKIN